MSPYLATIQPIRELHSELRQEVKDAIYGLSTVGCGPILFFPSIQRVDDIMQRTRAAADQLEENVRNHISHILTCTKSQFRN